MRITRQLISAGAALLLTASVGGAQATFTTSRATFGTPEGIVSWTQFGPNLTVVDNPSTFTVSGMSGLTGTVGEGDFHFQRRTQGPFWGGDFAEGAELLWTIGNNGPMTFDFSSPIFSFATQVDQDFLGQGLAQIQPTSAVQQEVPVSMTSADRHLSSPMFRGTGVRYAPGRRRATRRRPSFQRHRRD